MLYYLNFIILFIFILFLYNPKQHKVNFYAPYQIYTLFISIKYYLNLLIYKFSSILVKINTLKWKPIFKKSSYYGLYRANKNQWLNK